MSPETKLSITAPDRILLHLRDHRHHAEEKEFPQAITQKGIADSAGIQLTHVPRTLKALEERGFVSSAKGHVREERRRYKVYFLTPVGLEEADLVLERLGRATVTTPQGPRTVREILSGRKGLILPILMELAGECVRPAAPERQLAGPIPDTEGFIDREHELEELRQMLENPDVKVMVIYGSQGYGASSLAAKFVTDRAERWSVAWVEMRKDLENLTAAIVETAGIIVPGLDGRAQSPKRIAEQLDGKNMILVLDHYFDAADEAVEFLSGTVAALKNTGGLKMLVTARENTPAYNRFYTIMDQHDGTVGEVHIRGLDIESCRTLLGTPDIDPDALRRLFMFTLGKPTTIKLLARGDERELKQHTSFSPQEIKLMLYLKGLKKQD